MALSKSTARFYNRFSLFYPVVDLFLKPQKQRLLAEINLLPAGRLLEVGVGNGSHLGWYNKHEVIGIDNSEAMLAIARKKLLTGSAMGRRSLNNVSLQLMNAEQLSFAAESFDYAVISHVIAVIDHPEKLFAELHRVVKPGGTVMILNHFTPNNPLRFIDKIFQPFSTFFHFRSVFYVGDLPITKRFEMVEEISFGRAGYFKLLIYRRV